MLTQIDELTKDVNDFYPNSKKSYFRLKYLGKKGVLGGLFSGLKRLLPKEKKSAGLAINNLKNAVQDKINSHKNAFDKVIIKSNIDTSKPVGLNSFGSRHPISLIKNQIVDIFKKTAGISEGQIEDDWHNFSALNLPKEHPARDMQDTFFIQTNPDLLLRTHTSSVQVRHMKSIQPPIRTISPGRVYRNEAVSARAHCLFHQIEGLYIDEHVSFADLKQTIMYFAKEMFGEETKIRLRPSFFPFTEPSAEVDIYWGLKNESDYRITKGTGWLEILGCGMVDPNVLENCNIDSKKHSGFAFGGIERIAMLKYGVTDLRLFFENDVRFLKQFSSL